MGKYSNYPFGIDVSHWNGTLDWLALKGSPVKFACAKMGELSYTDQAVDDTQDSQWAANVQGAYDADIPIGGYMMFNAQYYPEAFGSDITRVNISNDKQFLALRKWQTNKKYYFLVLDIERWWQSYSDWNANGSNAARIPADWIIRAVRHFLNEVTDAMNKGIIRKVPIFLYSRNSFINDFAKCSDGSSLYDITPNYPLWEALYPSVQSSTVQWADLASIMPADNYKPTGMNGTCWIWQFSDRRYFPVGSRTVKLDANILMKPLAEFYSLIGFTPGTVVVPPVVPPEETVDPVWKAAVDAQLLDLAATATDLKNKVELFSEYIAWLKECPK